MQGSNNFLFLLLFLLSFFFLEPFSGIVLISAEKRWLEGLALVAADMEDPTARSRVRSTE